MTCNDGNQKSIIEVKVLLIENNLIMNNDIMIAWSNNFMSVVIFKLFVFKFEKQDDYFC